MLGLTRKLQVFAYGAPCDMRKQFNTLSGLVLSMGFDVSAGDVFLFVARNKKRAKVLWHDGTGLNLMAKRLDTGCFAPVWRRASSRGVLELTTSELSLFLEGGELIARRSLSPPAFACESRRRLTGADFS